MTVTKTPILLAYPPPWIYSFSENGIDRVACTDTEHYQVTKTFPERHEQMLQLCVGEKKADLKGMER